MDICVQKHGTDACIRLVSDEHLQSCGIGPGASIVAGLSGGPDSVALLLCLKDALTRGRLESLLACHVHHGIRGPEADADEAFCRTLCMRLQVPFVTIHVDVPALARQEGQSIETAAREARYQALESVRREAEADLIAVAHHRGDQAETVLMHLIRGSGLDGLTGMKRQNGVLTRPLLDLSKEEILRYLERIGETYRLDRTNLEPVAMRNRVRNELLPLMERLNPSVEEALCGLAKRLLPDAEYLNQRARERLSELADPAGCISRDDLAACEAPIRVRMLQMLLKRAGVKDVSNRDIDRLCTLLDAESGTEIELRGGFTAKLDAGMLRIGRLQTRKEMTVSLCRDGVTPTEAGTFFAEQVIKAKLPAAPNEAYLDLDRLPETLLIRTRRSGDRFYPLGAPGDKTLSDYFTDKKAPSARRDLPLLADEKRVYWVPGFTITELAKVRPSTVNILHILFQEGQ